MKMMLFFKEIHFLKRDSIYLSHENHLINENALIIVRLKTFSLFEPKVLMDKIHINAGYYMRGVVSIMKILDLFFSVLDNSYLNKKFIMDQAVFNIIVHLKFYKKSGIKLIILKNITCVGHVAMKIYFSKIIKMNFYISFFK
jgi:hypothetical protein